MTTTDELATQLDALAASTVPGLDDDERAALRDAATRLRRGQGAVYTIGRLLAPFLGRLVKSKPTQLADRQPTQPQLSPAEWDQLWGGRHRAAHRQPKGTR